MMRPVDLSLSLRPLQRMPSSTEDIAQRVRVILETQPGTVPWQPSLGCDLDGLAGHAAQRTQLEEARKRVGRAMEQWLQGAQVVSCDVNLASIERTDVSDRSVPIAETALASAGVSATLEVHLVLQTEDGPLMLEATMTP